MSLEIKIANWIKEYCQTNNMNALVVGISGGIDSALVSTLCCMTGIPTHIVSLPIHQKKEQVERAHEHAKWLEKKFKNVYFHEFDLSSTYEIFHMNFKDEFDSLLGFANSKSRIRMTALYQISASVNGIVVGTGNKVEDFGVGFYTKYGDGGVDISPIADLTKTDVRNLSKDLCISKEILKARPTDGLWSDDRSDEDQIGASYEELEWAMSFVESGTRENLDERQQEILRIYLDLNRKNQHKILPIPIFKK